MRECNRTNIQRANRWNCILSIVSAAISPLEFQKDGIALTIGQCIICYHAIQITQIEHPNSIGIGQS